MRHQRLFVLPAVLALTLAACGDDDATTASDGDPTEQPSADLTTPTAPTAPDDDRASADDDPEAESDDADGFPEHGGEGSGGYAVFERLDIEPGGEPVTVAGNVVRAEPRDAYIVSAPGGTGEQLYLTITSLEDNASVFVLGPDDVVVAEDVMEATIDLELAGDYLIEVGPTRGNTTYELTVGVSVLAG